MSKKDTTKDQAESITRPKHIFRVHRNKNFVTINKTCLEDKRLSLKAKGLHCLMLAQRDDWVFYFDNLMARSTDGETATRNALNELIELNYVHRYPEYEHGKIVRWHTDVYEVPTPRLASSEPKKPTLRKPQSRKPTSSKSSPNNNNSNKINSNKDLLIAHSGNAPGELNAASNGSAIGRLSTAEVQVIFDSMWKIYPLKKSKQRALQSLNKILEGKPKDVAEQLAKDIWHGLLACINEHKAKEELKRQGGDIWVPNMPHLTTWLNQSRWEDGYESPEDLLRNAKPKGGILNTSSIFN